MNMPGFAAKALFLTLIIAFGGTAAALPVANRDSLRASLLEKLPETTTVQDSLDIMLDAFDLSDNEGKQILGSDILDITTRNHLDRQTTEMICWLSFLNLDNEEKLNEYAEIANQMLQSDDKEVAQAYTDLRLFGKTARYEQAETRKEYLHKAIESGYFQTEEGLYDRIRVLGSMCILLGPSNSYRHLVVNYLENESELIEQIPDEVPYLKSICYNYAIMIYTDLQMRDKAVETARKRIDYLKRAIEDFRQAGRPYFDMSFLLFSTYRAILNNYEAMTPEEAEEYYNLAQEIVAYDPDAARENAKGEVQAYYDMSQGNYSEAIPNLQKVYENSKDVFVRQRALRQLTRAAEALDDAKLQIEALTEYNNMLKEMLSTDANETYSEMQIRYNVDELKKQNLQLELQRKQDIALRERTYAYAVYAVIGLLILIIIIGMFVFYRRRQLSKRLAASVEELRVERDALKQTEKNLIAARDQARIADRHKSEFIDNISHEIVNPLENIVEYTQLIVDCADAEKKKYLNSYADIVRLNSELLSTIINDILDIRSYDNKIYNIKKRPFAVNDICNMAVQSVSALKAPGINFVYEPQPGESPMIITDGKRVEQALINLLSNAAKFAGNDLIEFKYEIDAAKNEITFTVTDRGPGIPADQTEKIFDRFVRLDRQHSGIGLGLPIAKTIAQLLNGSIYVDTTYTKGARFVFTIPMS